MTVEGNTYGILRPSRRAMTRPAGIRYGGNGNTYRGTADPCHPKVKILSLLMGTEGLDLWRAGVRWRWRWSWGSRHLLVPTFTVL